MSYCLQSGWLTAENWEETKSGSHSLSWRRAGAVRGSPAQKSSMEARSVFINCSSQERSEECVDIELVSVTITVHVNNLHWNSQSEAPIWLTFSAKPFYDDEIA